MPLIPDHVLAEIRVRVPLREIVSRLTPLKRAGNRWKGCCPIHGERSPSFYVYPDHVHCYGCGFHGDAFAFVVATEGCSFPQAVARLAAEAGVPIELDAGERRVLPPPPPPEPERDPAEVIALARKWWDAAHPVTEGSPVARYLAGRGLWPVPQAVLQVLREADLEHPDTGRIAIHPVMLARVDDVRGELTAVHRTYLARQADGSVGKLAGVDAKMTFGVFPPGAAIRLFPAASRMGVAEGIETALAGAALLRVRTWSTVSAGVLEKWVPPEGCEEVWILADRDKPRAKPPRPEGQGMHSARVLAAELGRRGVACRIRLPLPPAEDYADVLAARRGEAA
jgi:hypothetical protein